MHDEGAQIWVLHAPASVSTESICRKLATAWQSGLDASYIEHPSCIKLNFWATAGALYIWHKMKACILGFARSATESDVWRVNSGRLRAVKVSNNLASCQIWNSNLRCGDEKSSVNQLPHSGNGFVCSFLVSLEVGRPQHNSIPTLNNIDYERCELTHARIHYFFPALLFELRQEKAPRDVAAES